MLLAKVKDDDIRIELIRKAANQWTTKKLPAALKEILAFLEEHPRNTKWTKSHEEQLKNILGKYISLSYAIGRMDEHKKPKIVTAHGTQI